MNAYLVEPLAYLERVIALIGMVLGTNPNTAEAEIQQLQESLRMIGLIAISERMTDEYLLNFPRKGD